MKVAIDARWIIPELSGIGTYTTQLVEHLAALDTDLEVILLFQDPALRDRTMAASAIKRARRFQSQLVPYGLFSLRNQWALPRLLAREGVDVYHSTNYMIPLQPMTCRTVATVHDVIPLAFPNHAPRSRKSRFFWLYKILMRLVVRRADALITVSKASKRDICHYLHVASDRQKNIMVVYNGVSDRFQPKHAEKPADIKTVLYVGRQDPYKNVEGLIRIFSELKKKLALPVRLIIAGAPDPRYPEALDLAKTLKISDDVECTGYLPPEHLIDTYAHADVLAHPSKYEGFGLQIVEAMACGLPVVCGCGSSLPEVAGDAALLVDPDDIDAFAQALADVLTQPDRATELSVKGIEQAARFSWKKTAQETLRIYQTISEPLKTKTS